MRGLCQSCAERRMADAAVQMRAGRGPHYVAWVEGMLRAVEAATEGGVAAAATPPDSHRRGLHVA